MALSLSHGKQLDTGHHGIAQDDLPPMDQGTLDPRDWFKNTPNPPPADSPTTPRPLELEIGSGKGTFLVQHAKLYPDTDFLGIEWAKAFWRYAADRARRHNFHNVRLLRCDADLFIRHYVPEHTFNQIHIYFPDPWPKKRHHKRRLIHADFLRELHRVLGPVQAHGSSGGANDSTSPCIHIATDHADYFDWMQEHAAKVTDLFDRQPFQSPKSAPQGELVGTNFERKYRQQGRTFQGMILVKR
jgi:tRNA (guanine-N7-)-methyltransferase